ncbi:poly [ADP-ribose] polymerase tankyrase isoform X2 [Octopus sinensis]|uniref:Poly [ADP-ribose] polymerase n=1 Tax=Octopus sinensis TaxID=2607531 RepID=A0A6P7SWK7_9MOLL|nr:poly [ADP-ribose] polymerase tankyrase isoform X2 [Octopus sinensis]XP_036363152.1 poly [ADP-ribose] polymerase tankyrase isoform X2 [Octopus sinensis]
MDITHGNTVAAHETKKESEKDKEDTMPRPGRRRVYSMEPRTPLKRQRIPVQRFQSPVLEEGAPKPKIPTEEKILLFKKGSFLAVRNSEGTFYVCKAQQIVYRSSKRFRIQWLNVDQPPDVYKLDYLDTTEIECVLCDVKMDRVEKDTYRLPSSQKRRAEQALKKVLNLERGLPLNEGIEDEEPINKKKKVVESSPKPVKPQSSSKEAKVSQKGKAKGEKPGKRKGGGKRKDEQKLKPNPNIEVLEKEPFFETNEPVPFISPHVNGKLAIRAVLLNDMTLLKSLKYGLDYVRSPKNELTALHYAIQRQYRGFVGYLAEDYFGTTRKSITNKPPVLIDSMGTGWYNPVFLGIHNIRSITLGRGNREGNNALTKDVDNDAECSPEKYFEYAVSVGASKEILEILFDTNQNETRDEQIATVYQFIHQAIIKGHRKLSGKLIEEAEKAGGHGYNYLHKEVLLFEKEDLRTNILPASVTKKPFYSKITPIHCAAINPNVKYLQTLLNVQPEVNVVDKWQRRPVHYAAACTSTATLEYLLEKGANPLELDSSGMCAIHYAAQAGRAHNVEVLLKKAKSNIDLDTFSHKYGPGALNRPNRFGQCPFHFAIMEGYTEVVKVMLKYQVEVNKPMSASKDKMSPLMIAACKGHLDIAKLLVANKADVEQKDKMRRTALIHAVMNGNTHVVSYLLSLGSDPNHTDSSGNSVVHYAAAYGWVFCLKLLVDSGGANPNLPNDWKVTPVCIAFLKGHYGLVDYLLSQPGSDINFKDERGRTLVSLAAESKLVPEIIKEMKYLVEKKADCSLADLEGYNPLHHLAINSSARSGQDAKECMAVSVEVAEYLIDNNCDPAARSVDGITPLMLAIEKNNILLAKKLLQKKGKITLDKNKFGKNILHMMAELCSQSDMISLLKEVIELNKTSGETDMEVDGTNVSSDSTLKQLAKMVDHDGYTPLLKACQVYKNLQASTYKKQPDNELEVRQANVRNFISLLIDEANPDINASVDKKYIQDPTKERTYGKEGKWCAVHFMVAAVTEKSIPSPDGMVNHCPGLKLILSKKPQLDMPDQYGCVPLIQAIQLGRVEAVKMLLLANANPNCSYVKKDSNQRVTPLVLIAQNGKPDLLRMLVSAHVMIDDRNNPRQQTALHLAVQNPIRDADTLRRVHILKEAGAKVNAVDCDGLTPLHCSVKNNLGQLDSNIDLEELLIKNNADVFAKDKKNRLSLHYAFGDIEKPVYTTAEPIELVQLLTSAMRYSQIDLTDFFGQTPLHRAACRGATICCRHLVKLHADINRKDNSGNTPLAYAVRHHHDSCALILLQMGANVKDNVIIPPVPKNMIYEADKKRKPIWKWQPIRNMAKRPQKHEHSIFQEAIGSELQNVAYMMLESTAMDLKSGIEAALNVSKYNVALRLIKKVHDISKLQSSNSDGRNLFHILALRTIPGQQTQLQLKIAEMMHEKRVSLNDIDMYGCTPLMYAALLHQPFQLGQFMSSKNSQLDIKHKDRYGRDVMAAFFWNYDKVSDINNEAREWLTMLMKLGASLDILFDLPPPHHLLFGEQINFERTNYFSRCDGPLITPLIFAICSYNNNLVRYLLKNGASPNFADEKGLTPIMHAVKKNDINIVKLLLNYDYHPEQNKDVNKADQHLTKKTSRQVFNLKMIDLENKAPQTNGNNFADDDANDGRASAGADGSDSADKEADIENGDGHSSDEEGDDEEQDADAADAATESSGRGSDEEKDDEDEDDGGDDEDGDEDENADDNNDDYDDGHDTDELEDEEVDFAPQDKKPVLPRLNSKASSQLKLGSQSLSLRFDNIPTVEKTSSVNLNYTDNDGRTVLHHLVCPLEYGTYDNDEILYVLFKAGAPLEYEDTAGLSPLKHTLMNGAPRLARMLQKLTNVERDKWEKPTFTCLGETDTLISSLPTVNFEEDSQSMVVLLNQNAATCNDRDNKPVPDANCNIKASGEIVYDTNQNLPYDILLTKVDVCCGVWGMYNFYKMQIVRQKDKDIYILFTRWGRIGDRGQFQHTPFAVIEDAVKEFCKVFKSKTGNDWNKVKAFKNHPKKYRLVETEERQKCMKKTKINFDLNSELPSKLPPRLQELIKELSNVKMLSTAYGLCGVDAEIMPFGQIKKPALIEGLDILHKLKELIEMIDKSKPSTGPNEEYQKNCEKIAKLSNEYFHLIPLKGYEFEKIRPIYTKSSLKSQMKMVENLLDYELASRILLGAQQRLKEINPLDYIYKAVGCHIKLMTETEAETQYILKYIYSTDKSVKVHAIYRLSRAGEEDRVQELNLENRMLLWHGSGVPNFISILSRGLLICPPEAPITGHLFGEGIYTADTFTKAKGYCSENVGESNSMFALLCEVALGKMKTNNTKGESSDTDYNSVVGVGMSVPDSAFDVTLPYGATLPLGPLINNPTAKSRYVAYNEYIVYDPAQVCQRYLVQFSS